MDPIQFIDGSSQLQNTVLAAGETLILANRIIQGGPYVQGAGAQGAVYLTPGPGAIAMIVFIRRGYGTTGSLLWQSPPVAVTAGKAAAIPVAAVFPADVYLKTGGGQVSLSAGQQGATGAGTVNYANMLWYTTYFPWDVPAGSRGLFQENSPIRW